MSAPDCGALGCTRSGLHSVADCLRGRGLPAALAPVAGEVPALRVALLDAYAAGYQLRAENTALHQARETLAAELRAMRVNALLDAATIAELRADRDRSIALLMAPLIVEPL